MIQTGQASCSTSLEEFQGLHSSGSVPHTRPNLTATRQHLPQEETQVLWGLAERRARRQPSAAGRAGGGRRPAPNPGRRALQRNLVRGGTQRTPQRV